MVESLWTLGYNLRFLGVPCAPLRGGTTPAIVTSNSCEPRRFDPRLGSVGTRFLRKVFRWANGLQARFHRLDICKFER